MLEPEAQTRCVGASAEDCDGAKQSDGSRRLFRRGRSRVPSAPRRSKKWKRPLFNWDINASVVNVCRLCQNITDKDRLLKFTRELAMRMLALLVQKCPCQPLSLPLEA